MSGRRAARTVRHPGRSTRRRPSRTLELWSLVAVTTLLVAYGGVAIATVLQRPPQSPVTLTPLRWQQFADSCVGTFVAHSAVTHPIALELAIVDRRGGTEITPEEQVRQVDVGHTVHFTVYETLCREIVSWHVREQSHDLRDDPVHTAPLHEE